MYAQKYRNRVLVKAEGSEQDVSLLPGTGRRGHSHTTTTTTITTSSSSSNGGGHRKRKLLEVDSRLSSSPFKDRHKHRDGSRTSQQDCAQEETEADPFNGVVGLENLDACGTNVFRVRCAVISILNGYFRSSKSAQTPRTRPFPLPLPSSTSTSTSNANGSAAVAATSSTSARIDSDYNGGDEDDDDDAWNSVTLRGLLKSVADLLTHGSPSHSNSATSSNHPTTSALNSYGTGRVSARGRNFAKYSSAFTFPSGLSEVTFEHLYTYYRDDVLRMLEVSHIFVVLRRVFRCIVR
jgi:hypothetical protein